MMQKEQLEALLSESENPKLEFKFEWYTNAAKFDDKGWGEFLKDIIALANGNVGYIGLPAYLVVGASDENPHPGSPRKTQNVPAVGMLSDFQQLRDNTLRKIHSTCSPPLPDIKFQLVEIETGKKLLVVEIPPPANFLKLDRDLNSRGMRFNKGTVLIRVGQDICVAGPTEIEALKLQFRHSSDIFSNETKKVLHNLPRPDYIEFVGRKDELNRLKKLLHPNDRIWCIVIDGIGGIGKSALALETAYRYINKIDELPYEERFDVIVWISAKTSVLTADGIALRYQATNTLDEIYRTIAIVLEADDITRVRFEEQGRLINRALTQRRTLLIIDNLETIDDERVLAFIRELPNPTKCIVTTRHRIDIADPIRLSAMPHDDALELITQECKKKNINLSDKQIDLLYNRTGGVPLAIVWSIAQMSHRGSDITTVLRRLGNARGDIAHYCFEGSIQLVKGTPAHLLLICLSIFNYSATRDNLGKVSSLPELDRDESLVELEKLSLTNKQGTNFIIQPLVKQYILSSIGEFPLSQLKEIVLRITRVYEPAGADAYKAIEPFFDNNELADLKEQVTHLVIDQMWEWEAQYDEMGVYYCIGALEKLATESAVKSLKYLVGGTNVPYAEQGAISTLGRLGEIEFLLSFLEQGTPYSVLTQVDVIEVIGKYGDNRTVPIINKLLLATTDEKVITALKTAKENIFTRSKS